MRYLKFYEAFQSKGISNTLKFIKKQVGKNSEDSFLSSLKEFLEVIDFPIDKISDDNIKYMNAKKALLLKNEEEVSNSRGIWVIKYWFSLKDGFLGYTATGNETKEAPSINRSGNHGIRTQQVFDSSDIDYIKDNITRTGEIWPVTDYKKLKTGDTVIGLFDGSSYYRDKISLAKIFVDERDNNRKYAIQSVASGSVPGNSNWRQYTQYGNESWWIFDDSELGTDHIKLHYYRPSHNEFQYIKDPTETTNSEDEIEVEIEKNPFEWNLPLNNRFTFSNWGRGRSMITSDLEKSDFALVLYFDDMVNPEKDAAFYEKPSDTREERRKEKEGATSLMSEEEIKKMNIERYIQKLVVSLNISETEFFNLEKIISKHLAQEFSYISIYNQRPDWSDLSDFTDYLYQLVDSPDHEKTYYLNRVKELYTRRTKTFYEQLMKYQLNKSLIKGDSPLRNIFKEIFKLGQEINSHFLKNKLNSIDELWITSKKIRSLYDYLRMGRNQLNYSVREVMGSFKYSDEITHYLDQHDNQYSEDDYNKDLEKINRVRNFLKTL